MKIMMKTIEFIKRNRKNSTKT